jgi:hypothetical protein
VLEHNPFALVHVASYSFHRRRRRAIANGQASSILLENVFCASELAILIQD